MILMGSFDRFGFPVESIAYFDLSRKKRDLSVAVEWHRLSSTEITAFNVVTPQFRWLLPMLRNR